MSSKDKQMPSNDDASKSRDHQIRNDAESNSAVSSGKFEETYDIITLGSSGSEDEEEEEWIISMVSDDQINWTVCEETKITKVKYKHKDTVENSSEELQHEEKGYDTSEQTADNSNTTQEDDSTAAQTETLGRNLVTQHETEQLQQEQNKSQEEQTFFGARPKTTRQHIVQTLDYVDSNVDETLAPDEHLTKETKSIEVEESAVHVYTTEYSNTLYNSNSQNILESVESQKTGVKDGYSDNHKTLTEIQRTIDTDHDGVTSKSDNATIGTGGVDLGENEKEQYRTEYTSFESSKEAENYCFKEDEIRKDIDNANKANDTFTSVTKVNEGGNKSKEHDVEQKGAETGNGNVCSILEGSTIDGHLKMNTDDQEEWVHISFTQSSLTSGEDEKYEQRIESALIKSHDIDRPREDIDIEMDPLIQHPSDDNDTENSNRQTDETNKVCSNEKGLDEISTDYKYVSLLEIEESENAHFHRSKEKDSSSETPQPNSDNIEVAVDAAMLVNQPEDPERGELKVEPNVSETVESPIGSNKDNLDIKQKEAIFTEIAIYQEITKDPEEIRLSECPVYIEHAHPKLETDVSKVTLDQASNVFDAADPSHTNKKDTCLHETAVTMLTIEESIHSSTVDTKPDTTGPVGEKETVISKHDEGLMIEHVDENKNDLVEISRIEKDMYDGRYDRYTQVDNNVVIIDVEKHTTGDQFAKNGHTQQFTLTGDKSIRQVESNEETIDEGDVTTKPEGKPLDYAKDEARFGNINVSDNDLKQIDDTQDSVDSTQCVPKPDDINDDEGTVYKHTIPGEDIGQEECEDMNIKTITTTETVYSNEEVDKDTIVEQDTHHTTMTVEESKYNTQDILHGITDSEQLATSVPFESCTDKISVEHGVILPDVMKVEENSNDDSEETYICGRDGNKTPWHGEDIETIAQELSTSTHEKSYETADLSCNNESQGTQDIKTESEQIQGNAKSEDLTQSIPISKGSTKDNTLEMSATSQGPDDTPIHVQPEIISNPDDKIEPTIDRICFPVSNESNRKHDIGLDDFKNNGTDYVKTSTYTGEVSTEFSSNNVQSPEVVIESTEYGKSNTPIDQDIKVVSDNSEDINESVTATTEAYIEGEYDISSNTHHETTTHDYETLSLELHDRQTNHFKVTEPNIDDKDNQETSTPDEIVDTMLLNQSTDYSNSIDSDVACSSNSTAAESLGREPENTPYLTDHAIHNYFRSEDTISKQTELQGVPSKPDDHHLEPSDTCDVYTTHDKKGDQWKSGTDPKIDTRYIQTEIPESHTEDKVDTTEETIVMTTEGETAIECTSCERAPKIGADPDLKSENVIHDVNANIKMDIAHEHKRRVLLNTSDYTVDVNKPIYIFVLTLSKREPSTLFNVINSYVGNVDATHESNSLGIRGSTEAFGTWSDPVLATEIEEGCYALLINDVIPNNSQYKWLDVSATIMDGDEDPKTRFIYEHKPFIDRTCEFALATTERKIAIVTNVWGDYSYTVSYSNLDEWYEEGLSKLHLNRLEEPMLDLTKVEESTISSEHENPLRTPKDASSGTDNQFNVGTTRTEIIDTCETITTDKMVRIDFVHSETTETIKEEIIVEDIYEKYSNKPEIDNVDIVQQSEACLQAEHPDIGNITNEAESKETFQGKDEQYVEQQIEQQITQELQTTVKQDIAKEQVYNAEDAEVQSKIPSVEKSVNLDEYVVITSTTDYDHKEKETNVDEIYPKGEMDVIGQGRAEMTMTEKQISDKEYTLKVEQDKQPEEITDNVAKIVTEDVQTTDSGEVTTIEAEDVQEAATEEVTKIETEDVQTIVTEEVVKTDIDDEHKIDTEEDVKTETGVPQTPDIGEVTRTETEDVQESVTEEITKTEICDLQTTVEQQLMKSIVCTNKQDSSVGLKEEGIVQVATTDMQVSVVHQRIEDIDGIEAKPTIEKQEIENNIDTEQKDTQINVDIIETSVEQEVYKSQVDKGTGKEKLSEIKDQEMISAANDTAETTSEQDVNDSGIDHDDFITEEEIKQMTMDETQSPVVEQLITCDVTNITQLETPVEITEQHVIKTTTDEVQSAFKQELNVSYLDNDAHVDKTIEVTEQEPDMTSAGDMQAVIEKQMIECNVDDHVRNYEQIEVIEQEMVKTNTDDLQAKVNKDDHVEATEGETMAKTITEDVLTTYDQQTDQDVSDGGIVRKEDDISPVVHELVDHEKGVATLAIDLVDNALEEGKISIVGDTSEVDDATSSVNLVSEGVEAYMTIEDSVDKESFEIAKDEVSEAVLEKISESGAQPFVSVTTAGMIDREKPIYIFVIQLDDSMPITGTVQEFVADYINSDRIIEADEKVGLRGSGDCFGNWCEKPISAFKLQTGLYGVVINEFISTTNQYKWLVKSPTVASGDTDPLTGYVYDPSVDRMCHFSSCEPGKVLLVINKWANDTFETAYTNVEWDYSRLGQMKGVLHTGISLLDKTRPAYLFVLKLDDTVHHDSDVPHVVNDYINEVHGGEHTEDVLVGLRGSSECFGEWCVKPVPAVKLNKGTFVVLINDVIPRTGQYKWLVTSPTFVHGDLDPNTGYIYESYPFVDRPCSFEECPAGNVMFIINKWSNYAYSTAYSDKVNWENLGMLKTSVCPDE